MTRDRLDYLATERGALTASASDVRELARYALRLTEHIDAELERHNEAIRRGLARAKAKGKHIGRPVRVLDLDAALPLLAEGRGLKDIARLLGVPRSTLRRRLMEHGAWPVEAHR